MNFPKSVVIRDDTMREGLQIESPDIAVEAKLRLLDAIGETGARVISIGSFAHPKWTPQMARIDEIAERFVAKEGIEYTAAIFNAKGFARADSYYPKLNVRPKRFSSFVEMCDTFARRNYNRSTEQQIAAGSDVVQRAQDAGAREGAIAVGNPFGSNFTGAFSREERLAMVERMVGTWHEAGLPVTRLSMVEAMGWNLPHLVSEFIEDIRDRWPEVSDIHCHLHNTRGMALTSYYEALKLGVREFDTTLGGMGGCPYCGNGRAAGMVPTEDFVDLCHELGIETGYDLGKLIDAVAVAEEGVGHQLWGHVSKAGPRPRGDELYASDMPFIETFEEAAHFRKGPEVYGHQIAPWRKDDALKKG